MPAQDNDLQLKSTNDEVRDNSGLVTRLSSYILPISIIALVVLIAVLVFVPMIKSAISYNDEYKTVHAKVESMEKLQSQLRTLDPTVVQTDLNNARTVIPQVLNTTRFLTYIIHSRDKYSLSSATVGGNDTSAAQGAVNSSISMSGSQEHILEFLDAFYNTSPYILSIGGITLSGDEENWTVKFSLSGYYINNGDLRADVDLSAPFVNYTNYRDVVDLFAQKAEQIASGVDY